MYAVAVQRDFIASHFLTGGDWGPENEAHAHHYIVEVRLNGPELDHHGYLVDICELETVLEGLVEHYRNKMLNQLGEFDGLNPSLEHLARIFSDLILKKIQIRNLTSIAVKIWENDIAWAAYTKEL
ncbi:MAG: 6-carboxytetrahydropterin synthase [Deltaproteobacteria bacterium]|jgi:6-pyruvoyltetrahydropterin/6-carboxytetrahydropterin synthase